jgi:hypothetical protein
LDRVGYGVHPKGWQKQTLSLKCSHVNAAASAVEHFSETVLSIDSRPFRGGSFPGTLAMQASAINFFRVRLSGANSPSVDKRLHLLI